MLKKIFSFCFRTSLFIIMSFIYAKLLVVVCIAYVISEVVTHNIPLYYYEVRYFFFAVENQLN